jgi:hypothetical protein
MSLVLIGSEVTDTFQLLADRQQRDVLLGHFPRTIKNPGTAKYRGW